MTLAFREFKYLKSVKSDILVNALDRPDAPDPTDPRIQYGKLIRLPNKKFSANWNEAVKQVRVLCPEITHVVLQNSDIQYSPRAIEMAIENLPDDVHLATWTFNSANWFAQPSRTRSLAVPYVEFTAPIISLELWDKIGGLDESCPHDWGNDLLFGYQAWELGYTPMVYNNFTFHHFGRASTPHFNHRTFKEGMLRYLEEKLGQNWESVMLSHTPNIKNLWSK